jgi:hypothetical protein
MSIGSTSYAVKLIARGGVGLSHIKVTKAAESEPIPAPGSSTRTTDLRHSIIRAMNIATDAGVMN